jgi:hypothetical protein
MLSFLTNFENSERFGTVDYVCTVFRCVPIKAVMNLLSITLNDMSTVARFL